MSLPLYIRHFLDKCVAPSESRIEKIQQQIETVPLGGLIEVTEDELHWDIHHDRFMKRRRN